MKMTSLHHVLVGDEQAPPVLFLHGFLGASNDWMMCSVALKNQFRCITMDLPGHGQSVDLDDAAFTFPGCAQAIMETLDQLQIERCSVVGYSMGGRIGLYLANMFPDRISKLVLESSSPGLRTHAERQARREHDARLAHDLETGDFEAFLQRWYAQPLFHTLTTNEEHLQQIIGQRRRNDPHALARALRGLSTGAQPSLWAQLRQTNPPTLLVVGEHDSKFRTIVNQIQMLQPQAQVAVVPSAGHNVHEEQPRAFAHIVRAFLAKDTR
jgi:2-succinyl-6-hydroxy-2,4-cyclohexadiene-1-carboxylate synthase